MAKPYGLLSGGFNYSNVPEDEFNVWYDTEHLQSRQSVQGFINGRRWVGADDPKISIATYDLESLDVLRTPEYRAITDDNLSPSPEVQASPAWKAAAGTPWTAKMRPHLRDPLRFVLRPPTQKV